MVKRFLDVTLPMSPGLPAWPGEPHIQLDLLLDMGKGDVCTVTRMSTVVHAGTHMDAPAHFIPGGTAIDSAPLDLLIGPCWILHVPDDADTILPEHLQDQVPEGVTRLLVRTRNSLLWDRPNHSFIHDFVAFSPEAAQWLVSKGIGLVGIDYLSVEPFAHRQPVVHRILLGAGLFIIEGLDLRQTLPGAWELFCLPLKIPGGDGAPARVVLGRNY